MNIIQLLVQGFASAFSPALVTVVTMKAEVEMKAELRTSCPRESPPHSELCVSIKPLEILWSASCRSTCLPVYWITIGWCMVCLEDGSVEVD